MYITSDDKTRALLQVPMILYTAEQILVGQVLVWLFKRWLKKDAEKKFLEQELSQPERDPESGPVSAEARAVEQIRESEKDILV